jgi:hypothetical protein
MRRQIPHRPQMMQVSGDISGSLGVHEIVLL